MKIIFKFIKSIITLVFLNVCFSVQAADYSGIWQDQTYPQNYYSIFMKNNKIVLIALSRIETIHKTLNASYLGDYLDNKDFFTLTVLSKNDDFFDRIQLKFNSEYDGFYFSDADGISPVLFGIRKIL
jgi:hypothetical protein